MCDKLFDFTNTQCDMQQAAVKCFLRVLPKKLACNLPLFSVFKHICFSPTGCTKY